MSFVRAWGATVGMFLALVVVSLLAISATPREAEAGCTTTSVCRRGRCTTTRTCSAPRVRRCSFVTRCTPQRTCVSRPGYSRCTTRDVCRRVEVCS